MDTLFLSNFFYDGICRLIPGIVVIGLYWSHLVIRAHCKLQTTSASVFLAVCIFLTAWLIGATLDTGVYAVGNYTLKQGKLGAWLSQVVKEPLPEQQQAQADTQEASTDTKKPETDAQKFERLFRVKGRAERVLFRTMMCISFFAILKPPKQFLDGKYTHSHWWTRLMSIICFATFYVCWHQSG